MAAFSLIPNSLFAGAYNGDFFPHGSVTYSARSFLVVVRQEICVNGRTDSIKVLEAVVTGRALLDAGYVDALPLEGQVATIKTLDGMVVTIKPLTAISRSDAMNLDARRDAVKALDATFRGSVLLNAGFVDTLPLEAEAVTRRAIEGRRVTVKTLTGTIEVC